MTKLPKDFGRIKMEEEMLRQDAKRRKEQRHSDDKMHPASILAICAGFVAMIAVVLYLGVIVDAFIGLMEII